MTTTDQARRTDASRNGQASSNGHRANAGRIPPHNLQAEESVLGAMLLSRDAIAAVTEVRLSAEDFYQPAHGHVFAAVTRLDDEGQAADVTTVTDRLRRDGLAQTVGAPGVLHSLMAACPATTSAARYARIVADHALLRRLIGVAGEISDSAYDLPDDVGAAVDAAEQAVYDVGDRLRSEARSTTVLAREAVSEFVDQLEALYERGETVTGVATGYLDFDAMTLGLHAGDLVLIGARPATGKSALALGMASHIASGDVPVAFFSLEMSRWQLEQRWVAAEAQVDLTRLRNGRVVEKDWARINNAIGRLAETPLAIVDQAALSLGGLRSEVRRLARTWGRAPIVVVDYLQLMSGRAGAESRQVEVAELSRGLKVLAREFGTSVVALAQLNRQLETRRDKRPTLADLRESGSQEQDADVIAFLYRDEMYNAGSADRGVAELIVAKQRNGPTGVVRLAWQEQYTRFCNMARSV